MQKTIYLTNHFVLENFLLVDNLDSHHLICVHVLRPLHLREIPFPQRPSQLVLPHSGPPVNATVHRRPPTAATVHRCPPAAATIHRRPTAAATINRA